MLKKQGRHLKTSKGKNIKGDQLAFELVLHMHRFTARTADGDSDAEDGTRGRRKPKKKGTGNKRGLSHSPSIERGDKRARSNASSRFSFIS
jgi:hypothetical protein